MSTHIHRVIGVLPFDRSSKTPHSPAGMTLLRHEPGEYFSGFEP